MYFLNTTLKFSAIVEWKIQINKIFSKGHVIVVFERLDFKRDKIYLFASL